MTLLVDHLHVQHGAITAIEDLSFTIEPGELVTIIGSNGAGKTTLLRALSGLLPVTSGSASWKGRSLLGRRAEDLVRSGIVHVSEGKAVIPELTVEENPTICIARSKSFTASCAKQFKERDIA